MILDALREATRPCHEQLEAVMPLMQPDLTLEQYQQVLQAFYGVFKPLEQHLSTMPEWLALLPDYPERQRTAMIEHDLERLDVTPDQQAQLACCPLPDLSLMAEVLGVMYVIEGSTLGGQHLVRHLKQHFQWQAQGEDDKTSFFNSYGPLVGPRWKTFCETLETYVASQPEAQQGIVEAAVAQFQRLQSWFETCASVNKAAVALS